MESVYLVTRMSLFLILNRVLKNEMLLQIELYICFGKASSYFQNKENSQTLKTNYFYLLLMFFCLRTIRVVN